MKTRQGRSGEMWKGRENRWVIWAKSLRVHQSQGCVSAGGAGMFYSGFFVVNLKFSVTLWWPVLPLCVTGHLRCGLMSCFTVPTVRHQHTFLISMNCFYLISDRDVNIHLQWSDHSWLAKIDCHVHLVVVYMSNASTLTARDQISVSGESYFRSTYTIVQKFRVIKICLK